jgi:hypothetical protein
MNEISLEELQHRDIKIREGYRSSDGKKFNLKRYALDWVYPLIAFIIILITYILVKSSLDLKDLPLESEIYNPIEGFSAARAYKHLSEISKVPHGFDSPNNQKTLVYIVNQVKLLQEKTDRILYFHDNSSQLALPQSDMSWIGEGSFSTYFIASNLMVKLKGINSNGRAIMLSAHYDTRPITPGASDAGIPVSISLEILEALIQSPPEGYDVMVNFNNGEEMGLLGSLSFQYHPWAKDVDSFINLEASGTGGKAFIFQSSSYALTKALSSGPHHHANAMSFDLFSLGIMNSATDYKVYKNNYNISGVDIAIYKNRAFYHSTKDDLEHASIASINQMGNYAYQGVKNIGKYGLSRDMTKVVAFDFLNSTPVYNLTSFYILIAIFYFFEAILFAVYLIKIRYIQPLFTEGKAACQISKSILFSILSILFTALIGFIIIKITSAVNINVIHSWTFTIFVLMTIVSFWCQIVVHLIWIRWDRSYNRDNLEASSWLGVLIIYNILVLIQFVTHIKGFVMLLFFVFQAWAVLGSFIMYLLFSSHMNLANRLIFSRFNSGTALKTISNKIQPAISFFVNYFFTTIVIIGLALPLLYSASQTAPTGTSPLIPYIFSLAFTTIICIPLSPSLLAMRHIFHIFILLTTLMVIICPILWTRSPYSEAAPLPITYNREVELDSISRKVISSELSLKMNDRANLVIDGIGLTPKARKKGSNKSNGFDIVSYDLQAPKLIDYSEYNPIVYNYTKSNANTHQIQFEFNFPRSKVCRIDFPSPVKNLYVSHINSTFISLQDPHNLDSETDSVRLMRNDNKLPWVLKFEYRVNTTSDSFEIISTCYEFNAEDLENIIRRTPDWIAIWTRDFGQLGIKTKYTLKLPQLN